MADRPRSDPAFHMHYKVASTREEIERVLQETMEVISASGYEEISLFAIRLSFEEALSNAMNHGNGADPARSIDLEISGDDMGLEASFEDEGPGYDPVSVPDPTAEENLTVASGRGLALIRAFMTEVKIVAPGNRLVLTYVRPA